MLKDVTDVGHSFFVLGTVHDLFHFTVLRVYRSVGFVVHLFSFLKTFFLYLQCFEIVAPPEQ